MRCSISRSAQPANNLSTLYRFLNPLSTAVQAGIEHKPNSLQLAKRERTATRLQLWQVNVSQPLRST
jgi:hypothetical protein